MLKNDIVGERLELNGDLVQSIKKHALAAGVSPSELVWMAVTWYTDRNYDEFADPLPLEYPGDPMSLSLTARGVLAQRLWRSLSELPSPMTPAIEKELLRRSTLAHRLWDSIPADVKNTVRPVSPELEAEINRRIAAADAGELTGIPWEDVRKTLGTKSSGDY